MRVRDWLARGNVFLNSWPWPWKLAYWAAMGVAMVVLALLPKLVQTAILALILVLVSLGTAGYFVLSAIYIRRKRRTDGEAQPGALGDSLHGS